MPEIAKVAWTFFTVQILTDKLIESVDKTYFLWIHWFLSPTSFRNENSAFTQYSLSVIQLSKKCFRKIKIWTWRPTRKISDFFGN